MRVSKRHSVSGEVVTHSPVSTLTFEKAMEVFLQAQDAASHSRETYQDYQTVVNLFIGYVQTTLGYVNIQQVTESDVLGWLAHLRNSNNKWGRPYSSRSIETYFRDVAVFFSWLVEHRHLAVNPMAGIKKPKTEKVLIRVFIESELVLMDAACKRSSRVAGCTGDEGKMLEARDRAILWLLLS